MAENNLQGEKSVSTEAAKISDALTGKIRELSSEYVTAQEWGIFRDTAENKDVLREAIVTAINRALSSNSVEEKHLAFLAAKSALTEAQRRRPVWYIGNTRFGLLPLLFTGVCGFAAYFLVFRVIVPTPTFETLKHPVFWGWAGAVLKALYWLQFQINRATLRPRWLAYFIVAPFIGVLLGAISFLIVKVGFKVFGSAEVAMLDWRVVGLFAAFAGFNWEWALEKFKAGAEAVSNYSNANKEPAKGR